jgi:DNA-binding transcriptional ArsR family regulator
MVNSAASDFDVGGGFKVARMLKEGYTGYFEGRTFQIMHGDAIVESFSDSQGKILTQLRQKNAMTPTQISEAVGATPAAVIYNLKPLVKAGVVERHSLPGGTVFYVLCWDVKVDLSPTLKAKIELSVSKMGGWSQLVRIPMGRLRNELSDLSEDEFLEVMRYLVGGKDLVR